MSFCDCLYLTWFVCKYVCMYVCTYVEYIYLDGLAVILYDLITSISLCTLYECIKEVTFILYLCIYV